MAPKIKIPVRRTGRALAHLHSKPSPHTRLVPHFAGTPRSPQIKMRSTHGWRQPELHFGEARSSLPGIPRTAWRRFAGTLRSPQIKMRFAHGWRQRVRETGLHCKKNNTTTMSWCYFLERATRLELATSTLARWRSTR